MPPMRRFAALSVVHGLSFCDHRRNTDAPSQALYGRIRGDGDSLMSIASILTGKKPLISVERGTTVRAIVALLHDNRIGAVLVIESGAILGIVSERDIVAALHTHPDVLDRTAAAVMTAPVHTVPPDRGIVACMGVMTDRRIRHLPVVEDGQLLGLVSIGDLVKRRIDDVEAEAASLKVYIQTA